MMNLQNMMGGGMQNIMDYTLKDLIMENYGNQLEGMDGQSLTFWESQNRRGRFSLFK